MAITDFDYLTGKLETIDLPKRLEWSTPTDFLKQLIALVRVKFPIGLGQKLVITGHATPSPDDIDKLWARNDKNNTPLGWFGYFDGQWRRFYTVAPGEVRWFVGDSQNPQSGWQVIDEFAAGVSSPVVTKLKLSYVPHPDDQPGDRRYQYFAARYIGYRG